MREIDTPGIDYYHLFYIEAIMQDSAFPQISKVKPIFEKLSLNEFLDLVKKILDSDDYDMTTQFLYFLLLFRDMKHLQEYINSPEFDVAHLEKLIIFIFGFCSRYNHSTDRIIDEILYFISTERLLELVLYSEFIAHDKLLLFFILTKFDTKNLNEYFKSIKNISEFTTYFLTLPENILKKLISRNYQLFQYIMLMMSEGDTDSTTYIKFMNKYKDEIEQFSKLHDIIRQYKKGKLNQTGEEVPAHMRDMNRISFLVNMVKELPDLEKAINYFTSESIFKDEFEQKIVHAIVTDPLLRDILNNYNSMLKFN